MGTKSPLNIVENALVAVLGTEMDLASYSVHNGQSKDMLDDPKQIIVACENASFPSDLPQGLGNYVCRVSVGVFTQIDDCTLADHREAVQNVIGVLDDQSLVKTSFAGIGDATAYNCLLSGGMDEGRGDRSFMTSMTFEVKIVLAP